MNFKGINKANMITDKKTAAFFDFDGTLYDGVVAFDFLRFAIKNKSLNLKEMAKLPGFLYYYTLDKFKIADRYDVNVRIYKKVKGWNSETLESTSRDFFRSKLKKRLIPEMIEVLEEHKLKGHTVIIVTSALREIVVPIAEWLDIDELIASEVVVDNSKYTGVIRRLPVGKMRIQVISDYCITHNIDIGKSFAYSDHYSDIPLLRSVGNPIATNPERKMRKYAKKHGWKIMDC